MAAIPLLKGSARENPGAARKTYGAGAWQIGSCCHVEVYFRNAWAYAAAAIMLVAASAWLVQTATASLRLNS